MIKIKNLEVNTALLIKQWRHGSTGKSVIYFCATIHTNRSLAKSSAAAVLEGSQQSTECKTWKCNYNVQGTFLNHPTA